MLREGTMTSDVQRAIGRATGLRSRFLQLSALTQDIRPSTNELEALVKSAFEAVARANVSEGTKALARKSLQHSGVSAWRAASPVGKGSLGIVTMSARVALHSSFGDTGNIGKYVSITTVSRKATSTMSHLLFWARYVSKGCVTRRAENAISVSCTAWEEYKTRPHSPTYSSNAGVQHFINITQRWSKSVLREV